MNSDRTQPAPVYRTQRLLLAAGAVVLLLLACTTNGSIDLLGLARGGILNFTSSTQGNILIGFVNNSPARAIFTFGGYDPLDENTTPTFGQIRLEAGTSSAQVTQVCRRVFSIGGADLVRIVKARGTSITDDKALITGVNFSTAPLTDPLGTQPTAGTAAPLLLFQGNDYVCDGLLLFEFNDDPSAAGGFRITYRFIPE